MMFEFHLLCLKFFIFLFEIKFIKSDCPYGYNGDSCDECGLTPLFSQNARIIGGDIIKKSSWPSMVYVELNYKANITLVDQTEPEVKDFYFSFGGVLIDRNVVLTTASCLVEKLYFILNGEKKHVDLVPNEYFQTYESMFTVYLGINDVALSSAKKSTLGPKFSVYSIQKHENYRNDSYEFDIGIIKLNEEAELDDHVQIACLPKQSYFFPDSINSDVLALGWGLFSRSRSESSQNLREASLNILDGRYCKKLTDNQSQICVGDLNGTREICTYDAGGPVFYKTKINNNFKYVLVGLITWDKCDLNNYEEGPKAHTITRVSYFVDWINAKSSEMRNLASRLESSLNLALVFISLNFMNFYFY